MASNAQKTFLGRGLNRMAEARARGAIALTGQSLPASVVAVEGSIVTVSFNLGNIPYTLPNVTIPLAGPEYIRYPTQVGDKGLCIAADAYLGGVSGLGGGTANLALHANLSCLLFVPLGNKGWSAPTDPNKIELYGPDGAILRDAASKTVITLSASGVVIDLQPGDAVTINGNAIVNGDATVNGNGHYTGDLLVDGAITAASGHVTGALEVDGALKLGGDLEGAAGGTYAGALKTSGAIEAGVGGADHVTLQGHKHGTGAAAAGTVVPTPGT